MGNFEESRELPWQQLSVTSLALLRILASNKSRFALSVNAIVPLINMFGFDEFLPRDVELELGFLEADPLPLVSEESAGWRITAAGMEVQSKASNACDAVLSVLPLVSQPGKQSVCIELSESALALIGSALKQINDARPGHRTLAQYLEESAVLRAIRDTGGKRELAHLEDAISQTVAFLKLTAARSLEASGKQPGESVELDGTLQLSHSVAENLWSQWQMAHDQIAAPAVPAASAAA